MGILRFTSTGVQIFILNQQSIYINGSLSLTDQKIFNLHAVPGKHVSGSNFRNFIFSLSPSSYIYLGRVSWVGQSTKVGSKFWPKLKFNSVGTCSPATCHLVTQDFSLFYYFQSRKMYNSLCFFLKKIKHETHLIW